MLFQHLDNIRFFYRACTAVVNGYFVKFNAIPLQDNKNKGKAVDLLATDVYATEERMLNKPLFLIVLKTTSRNDEKKN